MRKLRIFLLLAVVGSAAPCCSQQNSGPETPNLSVEVYFKRYVGLSASQIKELRAGKTVSRTLHSRTPAEIFVFGAVYVNASPDAYLAFATDFDRLKAISGYLAVGKFSTPPQLSELNGFAFDSDDVEALKKCKPTACDVQLPEGSMRKIQDAVDWSASNATDQVTPDGRGRSISVHFELHQSFAGASAGVLSVPAQLSAREAYERRGPVLLVESEIRAEADVAHGSRRDQYQGYRQRTGIRSCREAALCEPLFPNRARSDILHPRTVGWTNRVLPDQGDGIRAGRFDRGTWNVCPENLRIR